MVDLLSGKFISKKFESATKAFYSSVVGEKYIDFLIVTVSSYKKHNDMPIDWIVICKDEDDVKHIKSVTEFLTDDTVRMIYITMPIVPKEVDYDLYVRHNSSIFVSHISRELFCKRMYIADVLKNKYDLIISVDTDILFIGNIKEVVKDFFNSNYAVGGASESFDIKTIEFKQQVTDPKYLCIKKNINFGFGMLNTKLLRDDNYLHFLNISKDKEDWFCFHDQSYFAYEYQNSIKIYNHLQIHAYQIIANNGRRLAGKYKMIHFSKDKYLYESMEAFNCNEYADDLYLVTTLYFKTYALFALTCNISNKFRKTLEENLAIYCKKVTPSIYKSIQFNLNEWRQNHHNNKI